MISINFTVLIQMGLFLTLLIILNKFVFKPMVALLEERERRIKDPASDAKGMEAEVEKMRLQYEATLNDAKLKAIEERSKLRKQGTDLEQDIVKGAYKTSEEIMSEVRDRIEKETNAAREVLRTEVKSLSSTVATRFIGRPV